MYTQHAKNYLLALALLHTTFYSATASRDEGNISEIFHPGDIPLLMETLDRNYQFYYYTPPSGHTLKKDDETGKNALLDAVDKHIQAQKKIGELEECRYYALNTFSKHLIEANDFEETDQWPTTFFLIRFQKIYISDDLTSDKIKERQKNIVGNRSLSFKAINEDEKNLFLTDITIYFRYNNDYTNDSKLITQFDKQDDHLAQIFKASLLRKESSWKRRLPYVVVGVVALGGCTLLFRTEESEVEEVKAQGEDEDYEELL